MRRFTVGKMWFLGLALVCLCASNCVAVEKEVTPLQADVKYGSHHRNVLDFYQAESDTLTPVMICFHSGGFVSGDKAKYAESRFVQQCLASGISVVSANYRLVVDRPGEPGYPFPAPMLDGARVIQFVRSRAMAWHLDPHRIALAGSSAGACIAIWLPVHDDLARPDSTDPVERQSTRVSGVIGQSGQTTLDPRVILKNIGGAPVIHSSLTPLFGAESMGDLERPEFRRLIEEASALNHVTKDDPPLYLQYSLVLAGTPLPADTSTRVSIHHPMFGKLMQDKYLALGLLCVLSSKDLPAEVSVWSFLGRILEAETPD